MDGIGCLSAVQLGSAPPASKRADRPVGEWNAMAITMEGDRVTVEVNSETAVENVQLPQSRYLGPLPARGPIGLQKHGHGCHVEFRGLSVRELAHGQGGVTRTGQPAAAR